MLLLLCTADTYLMRFFEVIVGVYVCGRVCLALFTHHFIIRSYTDFCVTRSLCISPAGVCFVSTAVVVWKACCADCVGVAVVVVVVVELVVAVVIVVLVVICCNCGGCVGA